MIIITTHPAQIEIHPDTLAGFTAGGVPFGTGHNTRVRLSNLLAESFKINSRRAIPPDTNDVDLGSSPKIMTQKIEVQL